MFWVLHCPSSKTHQINQTPVRGFFKIPRDSFHFPFRIGYNRLMTATELSKYIGQKITCTDPRTGATYSETILDARTLWGKLQFKLNNSNDWFEPKNKELNQMGI